MDAIELLKQQHLEVRGLFAHIAQADDADEKKMLVEDLANSLAAHTAIEEKIFYPAAYATKTKGLLTEAVEEHLAIKRLIADLITLAPSDEQLDAKITVLEEQVEHHVDEEENELFDAVRRDLGDQELDLLGEEMEDLFEDLMAGEPAEEVPNQIDEAAPVSRRGLRTGAGSRQ
jgi:hemerythrin-like domain-containing protein